MKKSVRIAIAGVLASTCLNLTAAEIKTSPSESAPAVPVGAETAKPGSSNETAQAEAKAEPTATGAPAVEVAAAAPATAAEADPAKTTEATPKPASTSSANTGAPTETPAGPDGTEVVPLIVIDDVPLTDAIRNLARQSGLNFQFDPRVTSPQPGPDGKVVTAPNVSFRWENVSAQDALLALLDNFSLQLVKVPNSRIAKITVRDPKAEEPLISKLVQLKYADPTNMVTLLKPNLTARSQVLADVRTAQLIISTTAREWDTVSNIIARVDTPTKQVLIESKMLETSKNPTAIRGIDWASTIEEQHFNFGNQAGGGVAAGFRNMAPSSAFLNADGLNAVLSFLNKESDTEVVATPRAVTMDNQQAILQVTKAYPIFKITPGSQASPPGAEITYTNIGVILQVTPRITANNYISLRVTPEVSNIAGIDSQKADDAVFTANVYAIRRADTHVMIPSGNTLVMGGLISDNTTLTMTKVPLLGDTPGLGNLFRHKKNVRAKQNLLIFITPTVVEEDSFAANNRGTQFLKTKYEDPSELDESYWNSAKPADWTKPKAKKTASN